LFCCSGMTMSLSTGTLSRRWPETLGMSAPGTSGRRVSRSFPNPPTRAVRGELAGGEGACQAARLRRAPTPTELPVAAARASAALVCRLRGRVLCPRENAAAPSPSVAARASRAGPADRRPAASDSDRAPHDRPSAARPPYRRTPHTARRTPHTAPAHLGTPAMGLVRSGPAEAPERCPLPRARGQGTAQLRP
jgi:hypothetical protein